MSVHRAAGHNWSMCNVDEPKKARQPEHSDTTEFMKRACRQWMGVARQGPVTTPPIMDKAGKSPCRCLAGQPHLLPGSGTRYGGYMTYDLNVYMPNCRDDTNPIRIALDP